jgi:murein DD-endopeptidase MepM/ murein hydrolase activator NlpD
VAPGTIVAARDDLPDNTPPVDPPEPALDELVGNSVVEDIGGGRFAVYAHLQHHGVAVHVGDRVRRGEVLGQVGNSGGSSEPHLHFHLMDAAGGASALDANALPFVLDAFHYDGAIHDFETGEITPAPAPPVRQRQLPLTGDITDFGPGPRTSTT